jgi:hypothetical protein
MDKNEAILKIKENLKNLMTFSSTMVEDVKCESVKLKDGSEINTPEGETLAEGTECFTLDADGNKVACGDGPYELEDGRSIVVSGGKVESIKEAEAVEAVAEEMAAPMVAPEAEVEEPEMEEGDTLDVRVANLEGQIAQILELLQGMSNAQEMAMSKIKEIADAPATESIKVGKTADVAFNSVRNEMDELKSLRKKYNLEVKH